MSETEQPIRAKKSASEGGTPTRSTRLAVVRWVAVSALLVSANVFVYGQVVGHEAIDFDDTLYVWENEIVQRGITWEGIRWAFTSSWFANWHPLGNWHPLTWLSHMLDCQMFGLAPGRHLVTSLALHTIATLLLLLALARMTGAFWPSAAVAALFAIHPVHVESVAWLAERKDVLSGLFWMTALVAYERYARRPESWSWYGATILSLVLGLMAKPMVVTLPFVLLLLDLWPLGRMSATKPRSWVPRIKEKLPLFALVTAGCVIAYAAQHGSGTVQSLSQTGFATRLANAVISYATYVRKMIWPSDLAAYYPYPPGIPVAKLLGALVLLLVVSALAVRWATRRPFFLVGWLWFLGTLVPVIGVVQIGAQSMADRYTYIPGIGLFMIAAFGIAELASWSRLASRIAIATSLSLIPLAVAARQQVATWHDTLTVFSHAVKVTSGNHVAHCGLAGALRDRGRDLEAVSHYVEAIRISPDSYEAHNNLAGVLMRLGRVREALDHFRAAIRVKPESAVAHSNFGEALRMLGQFAEADALFERALQLDPALTEARYNWGLSLTQQGRFDQSIERLQEVLSERPGHFNARLALGAALQAQGRSEEAISVFREAVQMDPKSAEAHAYLGTALIESGSATEAASHLEEATRLNPGYADAFANLGVALFQQARYADAVDAFRQALRLQPGSATVQQFLDVAMGKLERPN